MELTPGHRQTEVGVFPQDWELDSFARLFAFSNGVNADKNAYGRGFRFINVLDTISHSHLYGPEIAGRVSLSNSAAESYAVKKGDVLFNRTSETESEVGLAATYLGDEHVVFGGFVIRARPKDGRLDPTYSGYALRAPAIRAQIIRCGQGAIRANIGQESLRNVIAPIPTKSEQRAIATALSDVDALLDGLDRLIAKKRDLKQAGMQQLLTGQTRMPGFCDDWKPKKFSDLLRYERPDTCLVKSTAYEEQGDTPVLTANKSFVLGYTNEKFGIHEAVPVIIFDDFTAASRYVDFPFKVKSSGIKILTPKSPDVDLKFVAERMRLLEFHIQEHKRHYISEYQHLELPVPSVYEQAAIVGVLSDMDAEVAALEARRDKTRALKVAMMQELLTGRTRLV